MGHHNEKAGQSDGAEYKRAGIAPSITFGLDTSTRATLSYYYLKQTILLIQAYHTTTLLDIRNIQESQLMSNKEFITAGKTVISKNRKIRLVQSS